MPAQGETGKGVMSRMEISGNVIHKGEKEEKYQLYVEDYVMSYLKNYGTKAGGKVFFFGKREEPNIFYIYGSGEQRQIPYFERYELLDEITYRDIMDVPVFFIRESSRTYELAGYDIFYQSNEAMQNYMVEQRKKMEPETASETVPDRNKIQRKDRRQDFQEVRMKPQNAEKKQGRSRNGLMAVQLSAIFVILAAIVINSTNSYSKLQELNQAAVEVFFAMENQEAGKEETAADTQPEENVLRLAELDAKFEEENQSAKQEDEETDVSKDASGGETETKDEGNSDEGNKEAGQGQEQEQEQEVAAMDEISPSKQAFVREFAEFYRIEKGDTLNKISIKIYGDISKVKEICELNNIDDPNNIKYGQKILLP